MHNHFGRTICDFTILHNAGTKFRSCRLEASYQSKGCLRFPNSGKYFFTNILIFPRISKKFSRFYRNILSYLFINVMEMLKSFVKSVQALHTNIFLTLFLHSYTTNYRTFAKHVPQLHIDSTCAVQLGILHSYHIHT